MRRTVRTPPRLTNLAKIDPDSASRPEVKQDMMYLRAFCHARQGMDAGDSKEMQVAGQEMLAFVKESPTSYRTYPAYELLGDLLVSLGKSARAKPRSSTRS